MELTKNTPFSPEYIKSINEITDDIFKDQSPKSLKICREKFMKLLVNGIPYDVIIEILTENFVKRSILEEKIKSEIVNWASFYDHRYHNILIKSG